MGNLKNLVIELAEIIPANDEVVLDACMNGAVKFYETSQDLANFMKAREDKNSSIDIYQMDNGRFAVDTSLISRKQGRK